MRATGRGTKPPARLSRSRRWIEALLDGEAEQLTRKAIELAKNGDLTALRLCLDRIVPPRKDRHVAFSLPAMNEPLDAVSALASSRQSLRKAALSLSGRSQTRVRRAQEGGVGRVYRASRQCRRHRLGTMMATNHGRRLDRLEEIHIPSDRPARWHRVIGNSDAELDERMRELIARRLAGASDGFVRRLIV
jgi:hypothetical protein